MIVEKREDNTDRARARANVEDIVNAHHDLALVVGAVGMLGLSMLLGTFNRRSASRRSRSDLTASRRESAVLRDDRDRLTRRLDDRPTATLDRAPDDDVAPAPRPGVG